MFDGYRRLLRPSQVIIPNATSFVGFAASQTSSVTPPTHQAPSGTQKDLLIGIAINQNSQTVPALPTGVGWTNLPVPSDGDGAGLSANTATRVFVKFATTGAEGFGTATDAGRCLCAVWRLTVAPATVLSAVVAISFDRQVSGSTNTWAGLSIVGVSGHVMTSMLARTSQAIAQRSDTISQGEVGTGASRLGYGRSNGPVSVWSTQTPAVAGGTETTSVAIEVIA